MANSAKSSEEVDIEAAEWAVRVDAGAMSPEDHACLDKWLRIDNRHVGAFAKACAILVPDREPQPAYFIRRRPALTRRGWLTAGFAASASFLTISGVAIWNQFFNQRYTTNIGETRVLPLQDGSIVTLNTNSAVFIRYTKEDRGITLLQGEALFDVAKDKARPFIVTAGLVQVRAVGTSFVVKALPGQPVQVLVREGIVDVKRPDVPVAAPVRLDVDMRAVVPPDAPIMTAEIPRDEVIRLVAWRLGRIAFHGETLKEAAAEFARYSDTRIEIDDPEIANKTVTGLFVANDPVGFAKGAAFSLDLHVEVDDNEVRITR